MAERDYFDIPDDETPAPEPVKPVLLPHTEEPEALTFDYPKQRNHASRTIIAVLVFLLILGACAFLVLHQIHEDLKPKKPAAGTSQK